MLIFTIDKIFLDFENLNQLCRRFTKFVTMYDLMPKDNLIVPVDSLESGLSSTPSGTNTNAAPTEKDSGVPNEEFYSSATIARPTAEPKEPNPEEPQVAAQAAPNKEASNESQEWNGDETVITNPSDTTITEAE